MRVLSDSRQISLSPRRDQHGYILLTLLLFVAMLSIAAAAIAPTIAFQIKRDREEEMIHRGVQYSRAIQHYAAKFQGRYPMRIEDLENTNNVRFLRKRYKDPLTGKDFIIIHQGDRQTMIGPPPPNSIQAGGSKETQLKDPQSDQETSSSEDKLSGQVFGGGPIIGVASTSKLETIREFNHQNHYNQWQFVFVPGIGTTSKGLITGPYVPQLSPILSPSPNTPPPPSNSMQ